MHKLKGDLNPRKHLACRSGFQNSLDKLSVKMEVIYFDLVLSHPLLRLSIQYCSLGDLLVL